MEEFNNIEKKYTSCCVCCDDFNSENIVYYKINNIWSQYLFCSACTENMLESRWLGYVERIKKSDCEKELKSLLSVRIPFNLTIDSTINSQEIDKFYWNNKFYSSELTKPKEINLEEFLQKLKQVYLNMTNDPIYDYLGEIKIIMDKFGL
jgi:hypothetical protein